MEFVWSEFYPREFVVAHFDARRICRVVDGGSNSQARACLGVADQFHYRLQGHQWLTPPILGDKREQPVLDFVPLTGSRWEVADCQLQPRLVGYALQRDFPEATADTVATATIGHDQQFRRTRKPLLPHLTPPPQNCIGGELRGIVIDPDANPTLVVFKIVHTVRNRLAEFLVHKIVDPYFLGSPLGSEF